MKKPAKERRKQPRVTGTHGFTVDLRSGAPAIQVKDISLSGISFRTNSPLEFMTRLMMTLVFPAKELLTAQSNSVRIQCQGAVVRCDPMGKDEENSYEAAVFFTQLDEKARETIDEYVQKHQ